MINYYLQLNCKCQDHNGPRLASDINFNTSCNDVIVIVVNCKTYTFVCVL